MIHITEGSLNSINIEILTKTLNSLTAVNRRKLTFYTSQDINLPINIIKTKRQNNVIAAIETAIENLNKDDILLTLPASKDDFQNYSGHTEYFRSKYQNNNIAMMFKGLSMNTLLLTDHIPLREVTQKISINSIVTKLQITLENNKKYFSPIKEIYFSGINPHAGEKGILGDEENLITHAIENLQTLYPGIIFKGPIPADTIHLHEDNEKKLFVFAYHDQGLGIFKEKNKLYGMNITLGLPFLRVSPDHGTAPDIVGKNKANYLGLYWLINQLV